MSESKKNRPTCEVRNPNKPAASRRYWSMPLGFGQPELLLEPSFQGQHFRLAVVHGGVQTSFALTREQMEGIAECFQRAIEWDKGGRSK